MVMTEVAERPPGTGGAPLIRSDGLTVAVYYLLLQQVLQYRSTPLRSANYSVQWYRFKYDSWIVLYFTYSTRL